MLVSMGKTKHSKIALRCPTNYCCGSNERKEYQDNERPKNKPDGIYYKYGVNGVFRGEQVTGHQSGGQAKRKYSRILRKKINKETRSCIEEGLIENKEQDV